MSQTHVDTDGGSPPSTPRWVKVFGIILIILILLVVLIVFVSGGSHGPSRHILSGGLGAQTQFIQQDVRQP